MIVLKAYAKKIKLLIISFAISKKKLLSVAIKYLKKKYLSYINLALKKIIKISNKNKKIPPSYISRSCSK